MKYIIVIDEKDFKDHIEEIIITHNNEEEWKDMIDTEYIKKYMKPMISKKYPRGSELFNDYVNGWNDCIDEVSGER